MSRLDPDLGLRRGRVDLPDDARGGGRLRAVCWTMSTRVTSADADPANAGQRSACQRRAGHRHGATPHRVDGRRPRDGPVLELLPGHHGPLAREAAMAELVGQPAARPRSRPVTARRRPSALLRGGAVLNHGLRWRRAVWVCFAL